MKAFNIGRAVDNCAHTSSLEALQVSCRLHNDDDDDDDDDNDDDDHGGDDKGGGENSGNENTKSPPT